MDKEQILKQYLESTFYEKYKETYVSDKILREFFEEELKLHRLYGIKEYKQAHQFNVNVMTDLLNLFSIAIPENNAKNSAPQSVNYCVTDFRRTPVRLQICSLQFALCSTAFFALFSRIAIEQLKLMMKKLFIIWLMHFIWILMVLRLEK